MKATNINQGSVAVVSAVTGNSGYSPYYSTMINVNVKWIFNNFIYSFLVIYVSLL